MAGEQPDCFHFHPAENSIAWQTFSPAVGGADAFKSKPLQRRSREAHGFASGLVFVSFTAKGIGESAKDSQMCDYQSVS